ncbi:energy-coupling factor transporter transmembrane protein EcfT, partial [Lactobacillus delbrueckii]|nr:energy-coupling factor transporter transmembrane protein EcfT [Lactobacillus delbrueckii]
AMNRSIALQLRGYASPKRRAASLTNDYWKDKFCHRLLIASCLVLLGVKACLTIFN